MSMRVERASLEQVQIQPNIKILEQIFKRETCIYIIEAVSGSLLGSLIT